jgi:hypothetical protein
MGEPTIYMRQDLALLLQTALLTHDLHHALCGVITVRYALQVTAPYGKIGPHTLTMVTTKVTTCPSCIT